jgi:acetoacetyl-CoA synthetase
VGVFTASGGADTVHVPDPARVAGSQLTAFMRFCEATTGESFPDPAAFHDFSVRDARAFWSLFAEWSELLREGESEPVCTHDDCEQAAFFPGLRLSYAENLLRGDPGHPAVVSVHPDRPPERLTRGELRERVEAAAGGLARLGLATGDRAVAVAANDAAAVVAGLATTALGATFSSAGLDMAAPALVGRFAQLRPKVLFVSLRGGGQPAAAALPERVGELVRALPSLTAVVALDDGPPPAGLSVPVHRLADLEADAAEPVPWPRLPFGHPLFVLFTSGTTGPPKCIVHGAGGTLVEHLKEHRLHTDLRPGDRLMFHTSPGWMMWNWQLSALASGCSIVLYDGPVAGPDTLWRIVADEGVTVFGTSPPYLQLCEDSGWSPRRELDLGRLRAVLSTGSVLHDWQYDWVRESVGDLPVQSISGGTDILGCFVLGNPNLPVRRGRIQCRSLGMDVQVLRTAESPAGSAVGELVCRNPFPSRPLGFLGDDDGSAFHSAYFEQNPGVWTHGDLIEIDEAGHARMHGRSDAVLNVDGIRIGPAEIYGALHGVEEVAEAMAVDRRGAVPRERSRLVLLVRLRPGAVLDDELAMRIRRTIGSRTSAAHVPELVVEVPELPVTHSGKRSERAARAAVNGDPVTNALALANPESLDAIAEAAAAATRAAPAAAPDSTEARVIAIWEEVLGISPIGPDDDFFEVGGSSLASVRLMQALHDRLGVDLALSTLVEAGTPRAMARLIDRPSEERARPLVLLRPGDGERPLFLVHSVWGEVLSLHPLARALDTDRAVYGLQARGLDASQPAQDRVEDMAVDYADCIRAVQPAGPYAIAGYSFGALVALEIARLLTAQGEQVEWLGLIDPKVHVSWLPAGARSRFVAARAARRARARLALGTRVARVAREGVAPWAPVESQRPDVPPLQERVLHASHAAIAAYRPAPYAGAATLFRTAGQSWETLCDALPVWQRTVRGELAVEPLSGSHEDIVAEPNVARLAELIDRRLAT